MKDKKLKWKKVHDKWMAQNPSTQQCLEIKKEQITGLYDIHHGLRYVDSFTHISSAKEVARLIAFG